LSADQMWQVDPMRSEDILNPEQETYVYLYSEYWSQFRASDNIVTNNRCVDKPPTQ
jgi:hypothetical protein